MFSADKSVTWIDSRSRVFMALFNVWRLASLETGGDYMIRYPQQKIAADVGLGRRTVARALADVVGAGFISAEKNGRETFYSASMPSARAWLAFVNYHATIFHSNDGHFLGLRVIMYDVKHAGGVRGYLLKPTANHYAALYGEDETDDRFGAIYQGMIERLSLKTPN